jgi:hypothetical protein
MIIITTDDIRLIVAVFVVMVSLNGFSEGMELKLQSG